MAKERLDVLLVNRGLAVSREKAKAVIMAADIMTTRHAALMKHTTTTYCMKPLIMALVPNT